ncbi:MAG: hypothetical protein KDC35_01420 [Acidobacteria bacterium]|nr:hypothetical protein [Acidobacteriota bacterium]
MRRLPGVSGPQHWPSRSACSASRAKASVLRPDCNSTSAKVTPALEIRQLVAGRWIWCVRTNISVQLASGDCSALPVELQSFWIETDGEADFDLEIVLVDQEQQE